MSESMTVTGPCGPSAKRCTQAAGSSQTSSLAETSRRLEAMRTLDFSSGPNADRPLAPARPLACRDPSSARNGPTRHDHFTSGNQDRLVRRTAPVGLPTLDVIIGPDIPATSNRPDGLWRNTWISLKAACDGLRWPCSQLWMVLVETLSSRANPAWDMPPA